VVRREKDDPAVREFTGAGAISGMLLVRPEGARVAADEGLRCRECGSQLKTALFSVCEECVKRRRDVWKLMHARDTRPMTAWELDETVLQSGRVRGVFAVDPGPRRGPHHRERPHPTTSDLDVLEPARGNEEGAWDEE